MHSCLSEQKRYISMQAMLEAASLIVRRQAVSAFMAAAHNRGLNQLNLLGLIDLARRVI